MELNRGRKQSEGLTIMVNPFFYPEGLEMREGCKPACQAGLTSRVASTTSRAASAATGSAADLIQLISGRRSPRRSLSNGHHSTTDCRQTAATPRHGSPSPGGGRAARSGPQGRAAPRAQRARAEPRRARTHRPQAVGGRRGTRGGGRDPEKGQSRARRRAKGDRPGSP